MRTKLLLASILSLAFLAWLAFDSRWSGMFAAVGDLTPAVLCMALLGLFATYFLRALRVYYEFRDAAQGRFATCLRIVLFHNALVNIVPFRGGELAFPLLLRRNLGVATDRAIASLLWLRLQDAFILLGLALLVGLIAAFGLGIGVVSLVLAYSLGGRDFQRPLCPFLALDVAQVPPLWPRQNLARLGGGNRRLAGVMAHHLVQ